VPVHGADREGEPARLLRGLHLHWRSLGDRRRRWLRDHDLDPAVAGLVDAVRRGHQQVLLAAADRDDVRRRDAPADELVRHHLGAPLGKLQVIGRRAHGIRMAGDGDLCDARLLVCRRGLVHHPGGIGAQRRLIRREEDKEGLLLPGHRVSCLLRVRRRDPQG
jgi:hypothetical protein